MLWLAAGRWFTPTRQSSQYIEIVLKVAFTTITPFIVFGISWLKLRFTKKHLACICLHWLNMEFHMFLLFFNFKKSLKIFKGELETASRRTEHNCQEHMTKQWSSEHYTVNCKLNNNNTTANWDCTSVLLNDTHRVALLQTPW